MNKKELKERLRRLYEYLWDGRSFESQKILILSYIADLFTEFLEEKAK